MKNVITNLSKFKETIDYARKNKKDFIHDDKVMKSRRGDYIPFYPIFLWISKEEYDEHFEKIKERTKEIVKAEFDIIYNGFASDFANKKLYKDDEELLNCYMTSDPANLKGAWGSKNNVMYINGGCITLIQRVDYEGDDGFVLNAYLRSTDVTTAGYTDALVIGKIGLKLEGRINKKFLGANVFYSLPHIYKADKIARRNNEL